VKVAVPEELVQVPESTPAEERESPGCTLPEETVQVYGEIPPTAFKV
jgi:hypothetical protein